MTKKVSLNKTSINKNLAIFKRSDGDGGSR